MDLINITTQSASNGPVASPVVPALWLSARCCCWLWVS
jgi:hypothetical protein